MLQAQTKRLKYESETYQMCVTVKHDCQPHCLSALGMIKLCAVTTIHNRWYKVAKLCFVYTYPMVNLRKFIFSAY